MDRQRLRIGALSDNINEEDDEGILPSCISEGGGSGYHLKLVDGVLMEDDPPSMSSDRLDDHFNHIGAV